MGVHQIARATYPILLMACAAGAVLDLLEALNGADTAMQPVQAALQALNHHEAVDPIRSHLAELRAFAHGAHEKLWRDFFSAPFPADQRASKPHRGAGHAIVFLTMFITPDFHDKWCRRNCRDMYPAALSSSRSRACMLACCIPAQWGAVSVDHDDVEGIPAVQFWEPPYDQGSRPEQVQLDSDPDDAVALDGPWVWGPFQREALLRDIERYATGVSERRRDDSDVKSATYSVGILVVTQEQ